MAKKKYLITAVIRDRSNKIIAIANNNYTKTHPIQSHFAKLAGQPERKYLHAEILALIRCGDKKPYSITVRSNGLAKPYPCPVCQKAIEAYGVRQVVVL